MSITVVLFFSGMELILAVARIRPVVAESDPYVGFASQLRLFEPQGSQLQTASNKLSLFNEQRFDRRKAAGTQRVFTVGGSTTYGRPFDDRTSYSGWLRHYLQALDPGGWEIINAGGISYASYRVAAVMEELVAYEPDLFIVYSGHNEFLERRTYAGLIAEPQALTRSRLLLQRSRLWALSSRLLNRRERQAERRFELTGEVQELLDRSVGLDYYTRDDPFKEQVLGHYRFNLQRMVSLALGAGAKILFVTVPFNEKDFSPFKSEYSAGLGRETKERHQELLAAAELAFEQRDLGRALELSKEAVALDRRHARGHYILGRALQGQGLFEEAASAFARAVEEDVCPLRALGAIDRILAEVTASNRVPLLDYRHQLKEWMLRHEGHSNLGDELFLDHVHPTVEAHGLLGAALVEAIGEMGLLSLPEDWRQAAEEEARATVLAHVDVEARARAYKNLSKVLIWAGKRTEAEKYIRLAGETLGDDWEVHYNAGLVELEDHRYEEAIESLRRAATLNPLSATAKNLLAMAYDAAGQPRKAMLAGREAVELDANDAGAWNNLGTFYGSLGEQTLALEATLEALRQEPAFAEAHNNLGKIYFETGHLDQAMESYSQAMELRPNYFEATLNKGLLHGEQGDYSVAVELFSAALELDSGSAVAELGLGKAYLGEQRPEVAISHLERALQLEPRSLQAFELLAQSHQALEQVEEAAQVLERGLRVLPQSASLAHLAGRLDAMGGRFDAAESRFLQAIDLDPSMILARVDLGNLLMLGGRTSEALGAYRKALDKRDNDAGLHHILASALRVAGELADAQKHLERALSLDPENSAARHDLDLVLKELDQSATAAGRIDR